MSAFDVTGLPESGLGDWIAARLDTVFGAVTTHVPTGFERYIRVFHPADLGDDENATWAAVARATGAVMHPTAQFEAIAERAPADVEVSSPGVGSLAHEQLRALISVLGRHTDTAQRCVFAFWEGWADRARPTRITNYQDGQPSVHIPVALPAERTTPAPTGRLSLPQREYALFTGHLNLAECFGDWVSEDVMFTRSPNLWWPADRTWFIATEVDFNSTLIGGSASLATDIAHHPKLESADVQPTDRLHHEADTINRSPHQ